MEIALLSTIALLAIVIVAYIGFFRKMPERIKDKLEAKIDPSNKTLFDTLNLLTHQYSNHQSDLHKDHDAIQHDLQELVLRGRLNEDTYKQMSADQRAVVDSVKKLEFFSQILQETVARNELLQAENERLRKALNRGQRINTQYQRDCDDYEMEL